MTAEFCIEEVWPVCFGEYTNIGKIGRSMFSIISGGKRKSDDLNVAIKWRFSTAKMKTGEDSKERELHENECRLREELNHDSILPVLEKKAIDLSGILGDSTEYRTAYCIVTERIRGKNIWQTFADRHTITEHDVANVIRRLLEALDYLEENKIVHAAIHPRHVFIESHGQQINLLGFGTARKMLNKKAGRVIDIIDDTEFCAPEVLHFDSAYPSADLWSVAVIMYGLLSGVSPFYNEDENKVVETVQRVKYEFDRDVFDGVSSEAKDFITKIFRRAPEMRGKAKDMLEHPWINKTKAEASNVLNIQERLAQSAKRFYSEAEEDFVGYDDEEEED